MDLPRTLAVLAIAITCFATAGARAEEEIPECISSERLEILNAVIDAELEARGFAPLIGCDEGPWRTFGTEEWPLSDTHADFIAAVDSIAAVPEPRGATSIGVALAALAVVARRRGRVPTHAAGVAECPSR